MIILLWFFIKLKNKINMLENWRTCIKNEHDVDKISNKK